MTANVNDWKLASAQEAADVGVLVGNLNYCIVDDPLVLPPKLAGSFASGDNPVFSLNGTNAADGDAATDANGGVVLDVGGSGSANDEVIMLLNGNVNGLAPEAQHEPAMATTVETPSALTDVQIALGLGSDDNADAPFDGGNGELDPTAYDSNTGVILAFVYDTAQGDAEWRVQGYVAGDEVFNVNTGIKVEASTRYRFSVRIDSELQPVFSINAKVVYVGDPLTDADAVIGPFVGVSSLASSTSRPLTVRRLPFKCKFA